MTDAQAESVSIGDAIEAQMAHGCYPSSTLYGDGHAGKRIAEALLAW